MALNPPFPFLLLWLSPFWLFCAKLEVLLKNRITYKKYWKFFRTQLFCLQSRLKFLIFAIFGKSSLEKFSPLKRSEFVVPYPITCKSHFQHIKIVKSLKWKCRSSKRETPCSRGLHCGCNWLKKMLCFHQKKTWKFKKNSHMEISNFLTIGQISSNNLCNLVKNTNFPCYFFSELFKFLSFRNASFCSGVYLIYTNFIVLRWYFLYVTPFV